MFYLELVAVQKLNKVVQELVMSYGQNILARKHCQTVCIIRDLRDFSE